MPHHRLPHSPKRRSAIAIITAILTATLMAVVGLARPTAAAGERITITTPVGRFIPLGQPMLLKISAKADSLVRGTIEIFGDAPAPLILPVELPGGTAKEFTVAVTPLTYVDAQYHVELKDADGETLAKADLTSALEPGDSVVGVFPMLAHDIPDTLRNPIGVTCHLFAFDPAQFEYALSGIAAYDVLVVTPDELGKLTTDSLDALSAWLTDGGRLVIDSEPGVAEKAIPAQWHLSNDVRQAVGNGEVVFSGGAIERGEWDAASAPVNARSSAALGDLATVNMFGGGIEPLSTSLARFTNASIASPLSLSIAIIIYGLVVGPGLYFLFRRRRARIWLAAPLVALTATVGVWFLGQQKRNNIDSAHGVLITVADTGSEAHAFDLQFASTSGTQSLTLPPGFVVEQPVWTDSVSAMTINDAPTGNTIEQDASSGSFGMFGGRAAVPQYDKSLVIDAHMEGKNLVGTVENHLAVKLTDVAVFWSNANVNIGDIEPTGTATFEVKPFDPDGNFGPWALTAWEDAIPNREMMFGFDGQVHPDYNPNTDVALGLWDQYVSLHSESLNSPDRFVVAGWSREIANPLGGDTVGTSVVVSDGSVARAPDDPNGTVGVIMSEPGDAIDRFSVGALLALTPPADSTDATSTLVLTRPREASDIEVFVNGSWVKLDEKHTLVALPAEAISAPGVVYVRCQLYPDFQVVFPTTQRVAGDKKVVAFNDAIDADKKTRTSNNDVTSPDTSSTDTSSTDASSTDASSTDTSSTDTGVGG